MAPQLFIEYVYFIIIAIVIGFIIAFYILTQRGGSKGEKHSEEQTEKRGIEKGEKRWMFFLFTVLVIGNILMLSPLLPSAKYAF
jgi:preprotein translocase subunit SecG